MNEQMPSWRYVGPSEIHDATVLSVVEEQDAVTVRLCSINNTEFAITFHGVREKRFTHPVGMELYSLSALDQGNLTLYKLVNWCDESEEEYDGSFFEVVAQGFEINGSKRSF